MNSSILLRIAYFASGLAFHFSTLAYHLHGAVFLPDCSSAGGGEHWLQKGEERTWDTQHIQQKLCTEPFKENAQLKVCFGEIFVDKWLVDVVDHAEKEVEAMISILT